MKWYSLTDEFDGNREILIPESAIVSIGITKNPYDSGENLCRITVQTTSLSRQIEYDLNTEGGIAKYEEVSEKLSDFLLSKTPGVFYF